MLVMVMEQFHLIHDMDLMQLQLIKQCILWMEENYGFNNIYQEREVNQSNEKTDMKICVCYYQLIRVVAYLFIVVEWSKVLFPHSPRSFHHLVVHDNELLVLGGIQPAIQGAPPTNAVCPYSIEKSEDCILLSACCVVLVL